MVLYFAGRPTSGRSVPQHALRGDRRYRAVDSRFNFSQVARTRQHAHGGRDEYISPIERRCDHRAWGPARIDHLAAMS